MLAPQFANSAQIDTFQYANEQYVMITFCFQAPKQEKVSWRPPIEFMPVSTIIMPRKAYKEIMTKFLGFMSRQDEPLPKEGNNGNI